MNKANTISLLILSWITGMGQAQQPYQLQVPGKSMYAKIDPKGISVLPSGRFIHPAGQVSTLSHDPFGLTVSSDGKYAVALHNGVLTVYHLLTDSITRIPDYAQTLTSPFPKIGRAHV